MHFQDFKEMGIKGSLTRAKQKSMVIQDADHGAKSPEFKSQLCCVTLGQ